MNHWPLNWESPPEPAPRALASISGSGYGGAGAAPTQGSRNTYAVANGGKSDTGVVPSTPTNYPAPVVADPNADPGGKARLAQDSDEERKRRAEIAARLNAPPDVTTPKSTPTQLAPVVGADTPYIGRPATVAQTTVGQGDRQGVVAPNIAPSAPIKAQQITAPGMAPVVQATAAQAGPAARADLPSGLPQVSTMNAAQVARVGAVGPAQIAPVAQAVAPTVQRTTLDTGNADELRTKQVALTNLLNGGATGTGGPTAADALLQRQMEQAKREQMGLAIRRAHGGNAGLAMREADENIGRIETEGGLSAAELRAKEQQDAQSKLLQALEGTRSQDIGVATKAAELGQAANLTEAQLQSTTGLANLDVASKTALTQAQLEQEAAQKAAERAQAANLTEAGFKQEAGRTNATEQTAANALGYKTEAEAAQDLAKRQTDVALANAGMTQQTNLTNAGAANTRAAQDAANALEAAKANQGSALAASTTTAQIGSNEKIQGAELTAKVAMDNAARELSQLQLQAQLNQQKGIHDADLEQQIAIKQAELGSATSQFNAQQANTVNVAQGNINAKTSADDLAAQLEIQRQAQARELGLTGYELEAGRNVIAADTGRVNVEERDDERDQSREDNAIGALFKAGAQAGTAALSDERRKKDITRLLAGDEGNDELLDAFERIRPAKFRYKNPDEEGAEPGERYGVMAQDLEKSPAGRSVVTEDASGKKMVDTAQASLLALAAIADVTKQVRALQEQAKARKGARR